jgi:hypothetical protein
VEQGFLGPAFKRAIRRALATEVKLIKRDLVQSALEMVCTLSG